MKKQILAAAMASVMAVATAASVSALETELDCSGWWTAHTEGVAITADGVTVNFNATTYDNAPEVWDVPVYVVYTGDEAKVNGAGYTELFVVRGDGYGWSPTANTGGDLGAGWSWEASPVPETWLADCKAGVSGSLKATKGSGNVTIEFTVGAVTSKAVIPTDADTVYVSLTGEMCKLTNIAVGGATAAPSTDDTDNTPAPGDTTGDKDPDKDKNTPDTGVEGVAVVAGLAIIATGAIVVAKKRK